MKKFYVLLAAAFLIGLFILPIAQGAGNSIKEIFSPVNANLLPTPQIVTDTPSALPTEIPSYNSNTNSNNTTPQQQYQNYGWYEHNGQSMQYINGNWYASPQQNVTSTQTSSSQSTQSYPVANMGPYNSCMNEEQNANSSCSNECEVVVESDSSNCASAYGFQSPNPDSAKYSSCLDSATAKHESCLNACTANGQSQMQSCSKLVQ
jgi:hypothetical protein